MAALTKQYTTMNTDLKSYNVNELRKDFPILKTLVHGKPLVYLDNAATTQKPQCVIDAITKFYTHENANIHRGVHYLSQQATNRYEVARHKINAFLGTFVGCETIFTRGATEAINLVAHSFGRYWLQPGDEILISHMEHHSNIVPWQLLCEEKGAKLRVIPISDEGELRMDEFERLLNERTKIVAVTHVSNALGTINPVHKICRMAREQGAISLVDGAQSAPHIKIDMHELGADFFACSGHKMYGPMGIGILYGRAELLERMRPYQSGGDMILSVSFEKTIFADLPHKFEAGTPNIEGVIGLGAAIDYLENLGMGNIKSHEDDLLNYGTQVLKRIDGLTLIGNAWEKTGILSFTMDGIHPHDIGQLLDNDGIAIRAGHHCAQPVMQRFGVPATARASLGLYNTREELDILGHSLQQIREMFN
jgi:cysteine desulfurase / selenocysteine lyase